MTGTVNPFYASGDGTVVDIGGIGITGVGYWTAIRYDNVYKWSTGTSSLTIVPAIIVRYFHLASKPSLKCGKPVNLDTIIGTYGHTGKWHDRMGSHPHVEVDTDINYPLYTPTLTGAAGGLFPRYRDSRDTTIDPASVFFLKKTAPENQTLGYMQSKCDKHPSANELYINVSEINTWKTKKV